jgi:hypothetical protein
MKNYSSLYCALIAIFVGFLPFCSLDAIAFQTNSVASIDTALITAEKNGRYEIGLDSLILI